MKQISRKLRSQSGATMLIAILFMMFCLFVGGSVLAAASANGYRVAHMADQQDFLSQRSAAILIADEINAGVNGSDLSLTVEDISKAYQPLKYLDGGGWENDPSRAPSQDRTITFEAPFDENKQMTVMQRLLYETAVCRYLMDHSLTVDGSTVKVELLGFYYNGTQITTLDQFWYSYHPEETQIKGKLDISGRLEYEVENFTEYTAYFTSGDQQNIYDFLVSFDFAQMTITADAYMSTTEIPRPVERKEVNGKGFVEITVTNTRTYINWNEASIQKGGKDA